MKWFSHLKTITRHKRLVRRYCFRLGLYRQGLLHDLSKFSPVEFIPGARYYQGFQSPNNMERKVKGYSSAWLHHKGRNKHHLEYWIDYAMGEPTGLAGMEMPLRYVAEMLCDRIAASRTYRGAEYQASDPWDYYARAKDVYIMHPNTRALLERMLQAVRDSGEDAALDMVRRDILKR